MSIRLVPNTGIQYLELDEIDLKLASQFTERVEVGAQLHEIRAPRVRDESEDEIVDEETGPAFSSRGACPQLILQAAAALGGIWVPLPFDRGGAWAAIYLLPSSSKHSHRAVLAVDTTLIDDGNPQGIDETEIGMREIAPLARSFWRRPVVTSFVTGLSRRLQPLTQSGQVDRSTPVDLVLSIAGLAAFLAKRGDKCKVLLEARPTRGLSVKVDVVLDLGNSRTAVLLKERGLESTKEQRLELMYPDNPTQLHACPFESQSAFVRHSVIDAGPTGCESFRFLSTICLGPPARNKLRATDLDPRPLGICSAKRYLWEDRECVPWEWRFINVTDEMGLPGRIDGVVLKRMNTANPLKQPPTPDIISPNYPRLAGTVWAVIEILEQAFRQVNSVAWRRPAANAPMCERRREIANVILIYPAGMHSKEIENFEKASARACKLWSEFRTNPEAFSDGTEVPADREHGIPEPVVQIVSDEGLAVQSCWLFGELMHRHDGRVSQLIKSLGRFRGDDGDKADTLRLASLDIGGGTIDLAIADYRHDVSRGTNAGLTCRRLFHDGISRAGDEILKSLLEEVLFPQIIRQSGATHNRWNQLFSTAAADQEALQRMRRKLVREAWMPLAMHCLSALEQASGVSFDLKDCPEIRTEALDALERQLLGEGSSVGKLRDVRIEIGKEDMRQVVRKSVGKTISNCADIVDQYGCDLLIVGGRPSSNPAVREHIYAAMAVPPGQVVFLSEMRVGDWYPFELSAGKIGDAKTCGVVGSLISFQALYGHSVFGLSLLKPEVPRAIIGYLRNPDPMRIPSFAAEEELGLDDHKCWPVTPMVGLRIATRRIQDDAAEAKPIYELRLRRKYTDHLRQSPGAQEQISVSFTHAESEQLPEQPAIGEKLKYARSFVEDVVKTSDVLGQVPYAPAPTGTVDANSAMELHLKTMIDGDGYWLDTGRFMQILAQEGGY